MMMMMMMITETLQAGERRWSTGWSSTRRSFDLIWNAFTHIILCEKKTSIFHILCSMLNHSVSDPGFLCLFNRKQTLCIPASCRLSASIHRRQTTQPHYSTRPWDGFPSSVQTAASHSNVSEYGSHKSDIYKWNHIFWGFRQTDKTRRLI